MNEITITLGRTTVEYLLKMLADKAEYAESMYKYMTEKFSELENEMNARQKEEEQHG